MAKAGRPTKYNQKIDEEICSRLATGESLRHICLDKHIPHIATIMTWVFGKVEGSEEFHEHYEAARKMQAELMADELNDIADNGTNDWMETNDEGNLGYRANGEAIQRSRLRVDTRKWVASRLLGKYSEKKESKVTLDATGDFLKAIQPTTGLPSDRDE